MNCIELYPSRIYLDKVYDSNYNSTLKNCVYDMLKSSSELNSVSVRNGWQSEKDIYNNKHFQPLCDYILNKTKSTLLKDRNIIPFISSMWINIHNKNGFNHVHVHSGAWYSGVYYILCSEKTGNITFLDPRPGAEMSFYEKTVNSENFSVKTKTGDLLLFPSWLPHLVEPNLDDELRISLAFNIELNI
jgi:uncharacterized protein (TIGR02466 family)